MTHLRRTSGTKRVHVTRPRSVADPEGSVAAGASRPPAVELNGPVAWEAIALDDLSAAAELLDQLENQGICAPELLVLGERTFVVRWKPPT